MEQSERFKNQNVFYILLAAIISLIYAGFNSNSWYLIPKSNTEILLEIGFVILILFVLKISTKIKTRNILLISFTALIGFIYFGKDAHFWGLIPKTGEEILFEVGMGITDPTSIELTTTQTKEIKKIIQKDPTNYNSSQKSLVFKRTFQEKTGDEILLDVGMGKLDPKNTPLTKKQFDEIDSILEKNPNDYNNAQKSLLNIHKKQ